MTMAKPTTLTEMNTGEALYPLTLASLVRTADGGDVEEALGKAGRELFIDMWKEACGEYGRHAPDDAPDAGHPFYLNGVWLTYGEAIGIMRRYRYIYTTKEQLPADSQSQRALLPIVGLLNKAVSIGEIFQNLIVRQLVFRCAVGERLFETSDAYRAFRGCRQLEVIHGGFGLTSSCGVAEMFEGCLALREVRIRGLRRDISFAQSPLISLESLRYIVVNAANTAPVTITVHPDVYAKLTGDSSNEAAAALTPEELAQWQQALAAAAEKNITFATI